MVFCDGKTFLNDRKLNTDFIYFKLAFVWLYLGLKTFPQDSDLNLI